ncbi:MAG: metallophosphoesterase [Magnetococcales bacterium]|nr:metallophosphoesterase [Magnetococcales bacterium]
MFIYDDSVTVKNLIKLQIDCEADTNENKINILQLSDLHLDPTIIEQEAVLKELSESVNQKVKELKWGKLDQVVFSGDFLYGKSLIESSKIEMKKRTEKIDLNMMVENKYHDSFGKCVAFIEKLIDNVAKNLDGIRKSVLVVPGNHDLLRFRESSMISSGKMIPPRISCYINRFASRFLKVDLMEDEKYKMVNCPSLTLTSRMNGVVAIVGFDSNHFEYNQGEEPDSPSVGWVNRSQIEMAKNMLKWLTEVITDRPLYIITVFHYHLLPVDASANFQRTYDKKELTFLVDTQWVIEQLQDYQVSLVLHGHRHLNALQNVSYHPFDMLGSRRNMLQIISCPPSKENDNNGVLLQLDLLAGGMRIEFLKKSSKADRPKSIPMVSASRISPGEMRLYREIHAWLDGENLPSGRPVDLLAKVETSRDKSAVNKFKNLSESVWKQFGYVQCCSLPEAFWSNSKQDNCLGQLFSKEQAPINFPLLPESHPGPTSSYSLLLLVRYVRSNNRYDILLNNHFPLRMSDFSAWDTLLMPAFKAHEIREFLYRIKMDMIAATDPRSNVNPYLYVDEEKLMKELDNKLKELNSDAILDIAKQRRFVANESFVRFSPTDGIPRKYEYTLTTLDYFAADHRDGDKRSFFKILNRIHTVDVSTLNKGALRWEGEISRGKPTLHRGIVWFPLNEWRNCPAIVARNADVMCWVETCLNNMRGPENIRIGDRDYYHNTVCLGELNLNNEGKLVKRVVANMTFDKNCPDVSDEVKEKINCYPQNLSKGLELVKLNKKMDLNGSQPYLGSSISHAYLKREKDNIVVFSDKELKNKLGLLRPIQRYVLIDGLKRVERLSSELDALGFDIKNLEGYLIVEMVNSVKLLSVLPPVIESTQTREVNKENSVNNEFLVCDGNHRIVHHCWNKEEIYKVVLIDGPAYPYYAYPFAANEWYVTASQKLYIPPSHANCKYTPRNVVQEIQGISGQKIPEGERFRRYFRDFDSSFIHVGGQGGRPF